MILTEHIKIRLNPKTIKRYQSLGYCGEINDEIQIRVSDLSLGSNYKIKYSCDVCDEEKEVTYRGLKKDEKHYCFKCSREKTNQTNLFKYGGKAPTQSKEVLKKRENVYLERYGFITNLMCEDTKEKIKKTCLEKYGFDNPSKNQDIKNKKIETCNKNYGVDNPLQNIEIFDRVQKSAHQLKNYKNHTYRGTYELDFLINFSDKYDISRPTSIDYIFDHKKKKYHPDYYLPKFNLIVEIKSDYTYECEKDQNEAKKEAAINNGFNFLFIINKDYSELLSILKS